MYYYQTVYDKERQIMLEKQPVDVPSMLSEEKILCKEDAYAICTSVLRMDLLTEEYVYCFCMDSTGRMRGYFEVSHGTVDASMVSPREIMQKCLLAGAVSFLLAHNHPSGSCNPSEEDLEITKRLLEAGNLMGIPLHDHLIVGDGSYCSMRMGNSEIWSTKAEV